MKIFSRHYVNQLFMATGLLLFALLQTYCGGAVPQDACGFVQNSLGQRISWKNNVPIKIYFHSNFPTQYRQAVLNSFQAWERNIGRKLFVVSGEVSNQPGRDNVSVMYWAGSWDNSTPESRAEQANTTVHYADNQVLETDIVVNGEGYTYSLQPSSFEIDVESLLTHELGHVLGLKHVENEPSVMNKNLQNGQLRRELYSIDKTNIKCEY